MGLRSSSQKYKGFIPGYIHIRSVIYYIEDTSFSQDKDTTHHFFHKTPDTTHHEAPISMMVGCEHSLYGNDIVDIGAFDLSLNRCNLTKKRRILGTELSKNRPNLPMWRLSLRKNETGTERSNAISKIASNKK